jgi:dihydroorotase
MIAAVKDGTIDCIASHHHPHEWDAKQKELEYASAGMAIQELAYNLLWDTLRKTISTDRLADMMAVKPREIFGLPQHGIAKGSIASLTLFTTEGSHTLPKGKGRSKGFNNPFTDMTLSGKVIGIVNNNKVHLNK